MPLNFDTPIAHLGPIGKSIASRLKKLELKTAEDLLWHFPFRYDDYSQLKKINQLVGGETVTIKGKVELITNKRSKVKRTIVTEAMVADETGSIKVVWFNQPFLVKSLHQGDEIYLSGKVEFDYYGIQFNSPEYEKVGHDNFNTARLVPVYSSTSNITQKQIRFLIKQILKLADDVEEWLPDKIKTNLNLIGLSESLRQIHFPEDQQKLTQAKKRLGFDELFLIQLQSQTTKLEIKQNQAPQINFSEPETKNFVQSLPFQLTNDQRKVTWEILQNLNQDKPMNRMLQGDVGSGKTVVAAIAMLNTALSGHQSVLMSPTEILAAQHYNGIVKMFNKETKDSPLTGGARGGINIALLTRTQIKLRPNDDEIKLDENLSINKTKQQLFKLIQDGKIDMIIGTHAIIQDKVNFKKLALAIIDEQHRFGVEQRHAINKKDGLEGTMPHFLSMTATPIPRSLSLALYGELDMSIIKEMPKNRKPIITKVVAPANRQQAYQFIRQQVEQNKQVFVVCPLIDPSDKLGYKSVSEEHEKLNKKIFPELTIGLLHGRLKKEEKEKVMKDFVDNKINILVSTSVIEVGVDIPNATVMMIEGAERFGLSQLHQFRGRVGRSEHQSYCFLFTELGGQKIRNRLDSLVNCHNGFDLAERDLQLRGPGEIYGTRQSGLPELKIASLNDIETIQQAKNEAEQIIDKINDYPKLKEKLKSHTKTVHLE